MSGGFVYDPAETDEGRPVAPKLRTVESPNPQGFYGHVGSPNAPVCRHYQFFDLQNGVWYIEVMPTSTFGRFIVQEIRNGQVMRRTQEPRTFAEARRIFWDRSHRMSIEAGIESAPPSIQTIAWGSDR